MPTQSASKYNPIRQDELDESLACKHTSSNDQVSAPLAPPSYMYHAVPQGKVEESTPKLRPQSPTPSCDSVDDEVPPLEPTGELPQPVTTPEPAPCDGRKDNVVITMWGFVLGMIGLLIFMSVSSTSFHTSELVALAEKAAGAAKEQTELLAAVMEKLQQNEQNELLLALVANNMQQRPAA